MRVLKLTVIFVLIQFAKGLGQSDSGKNLPKINLDTSYADSVYGNITTPFKTYQEILDNVLAKNKFVKPAAKPVFQINKKKQIYGKDYLFYLLSGTVLIFGLFKFFYAGYFRNIFQVFFNTSLRQNHLTDLLLQARLPSLIFNTFFIITAGLYLWLLLIHYNIDDHYNTYRMLALCIIVVAVIYLGKYCVLKFIGWLTGMLPVLNTYIFVIFLINKIIGITLIPFIVFLAFAPLAFFNTAVSLSLLILSTLFIMRFFRSFSILQHQLDLTKTHFFLYIISLEILPLIIIYKLSLKFL